MKTIYTCLPIYDRIEKQCFERSKRVAGDKAIIRPTITPRHKLPAFQWNAESDNMGTISKIEMVNSSYTGSETASEAASWTNNGFSTLTTAGLEVTSAISPGTMSFYVSETIYYTKGQMIRIRGTLLINSGTAPLVSLQGCTPLDYVMSAGTVDIVLVAEHDGSSFLVIEDDGNATNFSFTGVTITKVDNAIGVHAFLQTLPTATVVGSDSYYIHNGDTLNYLLPTGLYYLIFTMSNGHILYSEWFVVTCVYENLVTSWTNVDYNAFSTSEEVIHPTEAGVSGHAQSNTFPVIKGEVINLISSAWDSNVASQDVTIGIYSGGVLISNLVTLDLGTYPVAELNELTLTTTSASNSAYLYLENTAASNYYASIMLIRSYSEQYLTFNFEHSCDLGEIVYEEDDFQQVLYLETENMEPTFPYTERGAENGYGLFVPTFQRQDRTYLIKTLLIPQYIVDVLHRLKLHDTIVLTDLVGDSSTVDEIDVEHDWQFDDKYYALATITVNLGEEIIVSGCCTAVNECN